MQIQTFLALAGAASTWALSEAQSQLAVTLTPPHDKSKTNHVISRSPPTACLIPWQPPTSVLHGPAWLNSPSLGSAWEGSGSQKLGAGPWSTARAGLGWA